MLHNFNLTYVKYIILLLNIIVLIVAL